MQTKCIMGVNVHEATLKEAIAAASDFLKSPTPKFIYTPNPEMVVKAQTDQVFLDILNKGDLNLCDGTGLLWAAKKRGASVERITGVDFMMALCELCVTNGHSIFLLGSASREIVEGVKANLLKKFPTLKIAGVDSGLKITEVKDGKLEYDPIQNERILRVINELKPDILFVAFGMGKQEKWITKNISKLPTVKVAMGVGGAFDYISGKVPRAPLLLRKIGLEWLYRLIKQPRRLGRIYNATIKFSLLERRII